MHGVFLFLKRLYSTLFGPIRSAAILCFFLRRLVLAACSACFFSFFLPVPDARSTVSVWTVAQSVTKSRFLTRRVVWATNTWTVGLARRCRRRSRRTGKINTKVLWQNTGGASDHATQELGMIAPLKSPQQAPPRLQLARCSFTRSRDQHQGATRAETQSSGHSRTGHTGHTARLASKLARLANRLPGTNVPGWNFGWPTPKFPDPRPTLLIFRLFFPRLIFLRFSLAYT